MSLGSNLCSARKKAGLSQEDTAEKLGVSRQTISKWETGETLPDIGQAKRLASIYGLSLDALTEFDIGVQEIRDAIDKTSGEVSDKIDWTKMWSRKYPILGTYQQEVAVEGYAEKLRELLCQLKKDYGYSDEDACLVLKDILAHAWKQG